MDLRLIVAQIYSQARSSDAEKFLEYVLKTAPYKVLSIQIDGGSELMKDFEEACAKHKTPSLRFTACNSEAQRRS